MPDMPEKADISVQAPEAPKAGFGPGPFANNLKGFDIGAMDMGDTMGGFEGFDFGAAASGFQEAFKDGFWLNIKKFSPVQQKLW